ncbi:MAG: hypothetical protein IKB25_10670 [Lentisphaeria bacterium]|nr:hypothetical protein [Lentisphaeria bacterium]
MRFGYFKHWHQPEFPCQEFMKEQGFDVKQIDYSQPRYLEDFDVAIVEQNGFNDYIENDEEYIAGWVKRGGILLFMHQDYQRWAPYFLPQEVGYTQLIHRHIPTIGDATKYGDEPYYIYMMPWIEKEGKGLFNVPEKITPDEMIDWRVCSNTFRIIRQYASTPAEMLRTAAQSCYLANGNWEILGSYMDPGVRDGALILRAKYGKGMFFLNQLLFPEKRPAEGDRCLAFWKKYLKNLQAYFERFKNGEPEPVIEEKKELPVKKNYKLNIHMHSLDWYGCDSAPGTINAMMRYLGFDICGLAVKDVGPYAGKLDPAKYSDDKVLFLDGQEYHPFNWQTCTDNVGHNNYHMLPIGIDPDAYTPEFTRSLYGDEEVDAYLKKAINYVHEKHGAVCATHPVRVDYWTKYDFDAVDEEPLIPLAGTTIEKYWLDGGRIAIMNSVDLFGFRRILDNPAVNFVYLNGEKPCRDSVVKAVRNHHTIAAAWFNEADVTLDKHLPGDVITKEEAENGVVSISAEIAVGTITEVRVYSGAEVVFKANPGTKTINLEVPLKGIKADKFIRVEAEGENKHKVMVSTPFFVE